MCQKIAHRYNLTNDQTCPVPACNKVIDGTHHALLDCKDTAKLRTTRHHKAGRIILHQLLKGRKGGDVTTTADVGSAEKLREEGIKGVQSRIPETVWGDTPIQGRPTTKPDILLYRPPSKGQRGQIQVVEIKYGRDTNLDRTKAVAESQHKELVAALTKHRGRDCDVTQHVILLGVAGAMHAGNRPALEALGLKSLQLRQTLKQLHIHAIEYLEVVTKYRRVNIRKQRKKTPAGVT
jgi:hypothetical protein